MRQAGRAVLVAVRARSRATGDDGNALVEFLGAALILLIPTLYLVLVLGRVQAATFASEGAAREAGRVLSVSSSLAAGMPRAEAAAGVALGDQGFVLAPGALTVGCGSAVCLAPGSDVTTSVRIDVTFPGLGSSAGSWLPMSIPVTAHAVTPVDTYKEAAP
ncbi:pilus assembly protein [Sanguibacter sp. YZGR15]|uniref:Pilus assembly protein n=1 Tax=Sanguibacter suaedae TaxID=2795737 RepID=A0A934IBX6_9MICO|nr:pilus assembly protein [Sanguibacter suaedae]